MKSGGTLKRTPLKKRGPKADAWQEFRNAYAEESRDYEGLIDCEDVKLGLPHCGVALRSPDLHHIINRDQRPDLYFDKTNLVWLTRECHQRIHQSR